MRLVSSRVIRFHRRRLALIASSRRRPGSSRFSEKMANGMDVYKGEGRGEGLDGRRSMTIERVGRGVGRMPVGLSSGGIVVGQGNGLCFAHRIRRSW